MKKILKTCLLPTMVMLFATSAVADEYDSDFYENEGSLIFKIKFAGLLTKGKQSGFKDGRLKKRAKDNPKELTPVLRNGLGGSATTTIFFGDNIASELGLGFQVFRTSNAATETVGYNYSNNFTVNQVKKKIAVGLPVDLLFQYHLAPYGPVRPLIGLGYQLTYFIGNSKDYKIGWGHGPAFQVGVDFALQDNTLITLDVKHYRLNAPVSYKTSFLHDYSKGLKGRFVINPTSVSIGMGFKF